MPINIATTPTNATNATRPSVQSRLNETEFSKYLDGFQEVRPEDLLRGAKGGFLRYAIDDLDEYGRVIKTTYRLGGIISAVDPRLRYAKLFNPYAKTAWSVQLAPRGKRVRLYFRARATSDEAALLRGLLDKLDRGEITITKLP